MDTTTHTPAPFTQYAVMVKGTRGRAWYRADSAAGGDRAFVQLLVDDATREHADAGVVFRLGIGPRDLARPTAPKQYRPWDTTPDEGQDVNLDLLGDDDL